MRSMVLERLREPLALRDRPLPSPAPGQVRIAMRRAPCAEPIYTSSTGASGFGSAGHVVAQVANHLGREADRRSEWHVVRHRPEDANNALADFFCAGRFDGTVVLAMKH